MSKKFKSTGRKTLSVFLSATTTMWLAGSSMLIPIAASADHTPIHTLEQKIQQLTAELAALTGGSTGGTAVSCTFTKPLGPGSTGEEVRCLQKYLNANNFQVSATGAGSPGSESAYYGSKTQAAVKKWQDANNIAYGSYAGYFGPKSQAVFNATAVVTPPPPVIPPPPGVGTGLTVSAGTQVASSLAVQNAINVPYTRVKFTASADGDVTVNSLTVERTGLMNDAALSGVILLDENGSRLGVSKTLNSDHRVILNEPFVVKAGQTREMTLAGDMASSLGSYAGQAGFLSLVAVNTSAIVNGTLPITGVAHTVNSSLSIGTVTLTRGSNDPNATTTKDIGTTSYTFSAIKATAGSAEDVKWTSIRFYQTGSISKGDLANVIVKDSDGNTYPVTISADGKYYSAKLGTDGILIKKGLSKEVEIKADIVSGSDRTIAFDVWQLEDIVFHGSTFGYDFQGTASTGFTGSLKPRYQAGLVTAGVGTLSVTRSSTLSSQNIVSGGTNVPLAAFEFEGKGEPVTFNSWALTITTTDSDAQGENGTITNVTVYNQNGQAIAGPKDFTGGVAGSNAPFTLTFTDNITVPTGKNTYTIKGNLNSNWESNDTIVVSFTPSSAITNVRGDVSNSTITPSPSSSVGGQTMTIKSGSITISPITSFATTTVISNSNNVVAGRLILDASASGDDLKIKTARITKNNGDTAADTFNSLRLMDGTKQLNTGSNIVDPGSGAEETLVFTLDDDLLVTKGSSKTLDIVGDLSSTVTAGTYWKFDVTTDGDWSVKTALDGTDITETLSDTHGKGIVVQAAGGYTVALDSSSPVEKWVPAGGTGVTLAVLRFNATSEEIALTDLRLQLSTLGSSTGANFSKISLWAEGAATPFFEKTPNFTGGVEDFSNIPTSGTGSFIIPKGGSGKRMIVKADLTPIGTDFLGEAGALVGVDYDRGGSQGKSTSAATQKGKGVSSGTVVVADSKSDTAASGVLTFRSVPTVTKVAVPTTKLTSGTQVLYRFSVKADSAYDVALNRVTFRIATTGITGMANSLPAFQVYNLTDSKFLNTATGNAAAYFTTASGGGAKNFDGNDNLIVRIIVNHSDYANPYVTIPAGLTHQFELRGAITTDGSADSISTRLLGETAFPTNVDRTNPTSPKFLMGKLTRVDIEQRGAGNALYGVAANAATSTNFIWSDFSSDATTTHSVSTADWMNGFKILPTTDGLDAEVIANSG